MRHVKPLVSIVMPMKNSERFVGQAIESVIAQSYKNWELLVIDDSSIDKSCEIAQRYVEQDSRIRLYKFEQSVGLPSAPRNFGIQKSKGQYIAFLDSDDMWLHDKLSQQVPFLQDKRTAVVYSDYEKIDESGNRAARVVKAPRKTDYKQLLGGNVIGNLTGIFDTRKVGKNYFLDIHHEDYAFWLSVLKSGYLARNTQTITALYRVRSGSLTNHNIAVIVWQWHVYRRVEHIGFFRSCGYFILYAYRAFVKSLI